MLAFCGNNVRCWSIMIITSTVLLTRIIEFSNANEHTFSKLSIIQQHVAKKNTQAFCWIFKKTTSEEAMYSSNPWFLELLHKDTQLDRAPSFLARYNVENFPSQDFKTALISSEGGHPQADACIGVETVAAGCSNGLVAAVGNCQISAKTKENTNDFSKEVEIFKIPIPTTGGQNMTSRHTAAILPYPRTGAAVGILPLNTASRLVIVAGGWESEDDRFQWLSDRVHVFGEIGADESDWGFELLGARQLSVARAHVSTLCTRHACLFAGGCGDPPDPTKSNSNAEDNFFPQVDIFELGKRGWGKTYLSEPRLGMATILITLHTEEGEALELGLLAGGLSASGPSRTVDVYDFQGNRLLHPLELPTTSGSELRAVRMSPSAVAFVSKSVSGQGLVDILDGDSGCWFSTMIPGEFAFSDADADVQLTSFGVATLSAVFGNHLLQGRDVDSEGSCESAGGVELTITQGQCVNWGEGMPNSTFQVQDKVHFPVLKQSGNLYDELEGDMSDNLFSPDRLVLYVLFASTALAVSYIISSLIIIRYTEGVWRIPFPPRSPACRRLAKCCCCEPAGDYSSTMIIRRMSCLNQPPFRSREILKGGRETEVTELTDGLTRRWARSPRDSSGPVVVGYNAFQVQGGAADHLASDQTHRHRRRLLSEFSEENSVSIPYQGPTAPYP